MRFKNIFHQAYLLTIHNPVLWLFGLVLLGGFNLSLVNFLALVPESAWKVWPMPWEAMVSPQPFGIFLMILAAVVSFVILNLIKLFFLTVAHKLVHKTEEKKCRLCVHEEKKDAPYFVWWFRLLIASAITIALTVCLSLPANALAQLNAYGNSAAIVINFLLVIILACTLGIWNVFTGYFIVWHGLNFPAAARASLGLLIARFRQVLEFVVVLSAIYTVSVMVGNAFISVWQHGFAGTEFFGLRPLALVIFVLWLAANNTYFNIAFMLFFDSAVRSITTPEEAEAPVPIV